jgi:hypothetical protein
MPSSFCFGIRPKRYYIRFANHYFFMSANLQSLINQSQSAIPTVQGNFQGTAHNRTSAKYANNTSGNTLFTVKVNACSHGDDRVVDLIETQLD